MSLVHDRLQGENMALVEENRKLKEELELLKKEHGVIDRKPATNKMRTEITKPEDE